MREILERNSFEGWAQVQRDEGRTEWTVADVKGVVHYFFRPDRPLSQRTVYDICRTYTQILSVEVKSRKRRNFNEQVFTPEQVVEILQGISRKLNSTLSYAEAFLEMRHRKFGEEPSVFPASASQVDLGDSSEVLAELRSLRAEVAQLRGTGSGESPSELEQLRSEVAALRSSVPTRTDLWRMAVTVVGLLGGDVSPERFMAYLGVDESELEALSRFGLDGSGE